MACACRIHMGQVLFQIKKKKKNGHKCIVYFLTLTVGYSPLCNYELFYFINNPNNPLHSSKSINQSENIIKYILR